MNYEKSYCQKKSQEYMNIILKVCAERRANKRKIKGLEKCCTDEWRKLFPIPPKDDYTIDTSELNEDNIVKIDLTYDTNENKKLKLSDDIEMNESEDMKSAIEKHNDMIVEDDKIDDATAAEIDEMTEQLLEGIQDDTLEKDFFEKIVHHRYFSKICIKLAELATPENVLKICVFFCSKVDVNLPIYIKIFFTSFILVLLRRNIPSRTIDNALLQCIKIYPWEVSKYVALPLIYYSRPISFLTFIVSNLDDKYKIFILKAFLDNCNYAVEEWVFPIISTLYKSTPYVEENFYLFVQFLDHSSKRFYNNIAFGKLLYAVLQTPRNASVTMLGMLQRIIAENQTSFKTSCLNFLEKWNLSPMKNKL